MEAPQADHALWEMADCSISILGTPPRVMRKYKTFKSAMWSTLLVIEATF